MNRDLQSSLPQVRTLEPQEIHTYLRIADRLAKGEIPNIVEEFGYPLRYENGLLLAEPPQAHPFVVRFPDTCFFFSPHEPLQAEFWFETLLRDREHGIVFYPSPELIPHNLSREDLPIQVGTIRVSCPTREARKEKNPVSGHEALLLVEPSSGGVQLEGFSPSSLRTLKADLSFFLSPPPAAIPKSDKERNRQLSVDRELTRAFQKDFERLYTEYLDGPPVERTNARARPHP